MSEQVFWKNIFDKLSKLNEEELEDFFIHSRPHYCTTCEDFVKVTKNSELVNSMYRGDDIKYEYKYLTCKKCGSIVSNILIDKLNEYNKFIEYKLKVNDKTI